MNKKPLYKYILFGAFVLGLSIATPAVAASDNGQRTVNQIAADVKSAVGQYNDVQVQVIEDGEVLLTGTVKTDTEMDDAVSRARDIAGVTNVENEIRVVGPESGNVGTYIDDAGITAAVKAKFLGQDGLDSSEITVETIKGVVTLTGEVNNQAQVGLADKVARAADGVKDVRNQLTVQ